MGAILGIYDPRSRHALNERMSFIAGMEAEVSHRAPGGFRSAVSLDGLFILAHGKSGSKSDFQPAVSAESQAILAYDGTLFNLDDLDSSAGAEEPGRLLRLAQTGFARMLPRLDGIFALAFREAGGPLYLARDLFSAQPLYWMESNGVIAFSSELRPLQILPFFDAAIDADCIAEFLSFQYVGAPRTIYRSVRKLPGGHWLRFHADTGATIHKYGAFTPGFPEADTRTLQEQAEELEALLVRRIKAVCEGKKFVAACLSGGMDSSAVAMLAARHTGLPLHTFTIGYPTAEESEHRQACAFAGIIGSIHHEHLLEADALDFLLTSGKIMDEPNGDSSCLPTFLLAKYIREYSDTALCGDFADELFGGYRRYFRVGKLAEGDNLSLGHLYYSTAMLYFSESEIGHLFGNVPGGYADRLESLRAEMNDLDWLHPLHVMRKTDMENYTPGAPGPKAERMGMRHGLEFCSPFTNQAIMRLAESLPPSSLAEGDKGKLVLRNIAYKYLPSEMIDRPKRGFVIAKGGEWRERMLQIAGELLLDRGAQLGTILAKKKLAAFVGKQSREFNFNQIWIACVLESYLRSNPAVLSAHDPDNIIIYKRQPCGAKAQNTIFYPHPISAGGRNYVIFVNNIDDLDFDNCKLPAPFVVTIDAPAFHREKTAVFNWRSEKDWSGLVSLLPECPIAFFPAYGIPDRKYLGRAASIGIELTVIRIADQYASMPTKIASISQRLYNIGKLIISGVPNVNKDLL